MRFETNGGNERMRIDSDGDILIGNQQTSIQGGGVGATNTYLQVHGPSGAAGVLNLGRDTNSDNQSLGEVRFFNANNADDNNNDADAKLVAVIQARVETSDSNAGDDSGAHIIFSTKPEAGSLDERARITSSGNFLVGRDSVGNTGNGHSIRGGDSAIFSRDATGESVQIGRNANDGQLIQFRDNGTEVGDIRVDGTTVSLTGFAGNHESSGISESTELGTVVSTIDELDTRKLADGSVVDHKNHAKIKVSDSVGDKRVYGVLNKFVEHSSGVTKALVTSVGISSIRVTGACEGGDLLESNGDGTAKVQSDDIIRSKTIGKVTIGNSDTGVKLVSCVLYCG
jgi:hypothetical protein